MTDRVIRHLIEIKSFCRCIVNYFLHQFRMPRVGEEVGKPEGLMTREGVEKDLEITFRSY
ncbi:MAG: hypothetical protein NT004_07050 [Bacteroidetes bacterium]|nr:hypothetical protein [Bacteroidota bacterium]